MALLLTERDVHDLLQPVELIDARESALSAFSTQQVVQPVRSVLPLSERGFFGVMPAYMPGLSVHGAKHVTVLPGNLERGIPTHQATILLHDPGTGELLAIVDGRLITELRTGAVSALSARYLAREDSKVLAILGSGVQARSHLQMLTPVRGFREIRAWSPTRARLEVFVAESKGQVIAADSAEEALRGADVVVLATASPVPVIRNEWVSPGTHVISIGACVPTQQEMDPELVARAFLVVDSRAAALKESGDVIPLGPGHIRAELGERPVRKDPGDVTVFKSLGLAVEDLAAAHLVYRRALETRKGFEFDF